MDNQIKSVQVLNSKGIYVTLPLKGHENRTKEKWMEKYGPGGKCEGAIHDPLAAWKALEAAHNQNTGSKSRTESKPKPKAKPKVKPEASSDEQS